MTEHVTAEVAQDSAGPGSLADGLLSELSPDSSCCRQLNWRCDLKDGELDPAWVESELEAEGFVSRCRHPALKVYRQPGGHEVAWVVPTGRVQIRVDLGVPKKRRRKEAELVRQAFGRVLAETQRRE